MPNRFYRSVKGSSAKVKVDLITGEFPEIAGQGTHLRIQELAVWKARGIDLAFIFQQEVPVEGILPDGGRNTVKAKAPKIGAHLCIKAITMSERMKEKDAYDICFCIENYAGGYKALAEELCAMLPNKQIAEGIAILREKFSAVDSIGPVWAARTALGATDGMDLGPELLQQERSAYEVMAALLRAIDEKTMAAEKSSQ
jgi:hypothetical protein